MIVGPAKDTHAVAAALFRNSRRLTVFTFLACALFSGFPAFLCEDLVLYFIGNSDQSYQTYATLAMRICLHLNRIQLILQM